MFEAGMRMICDCHPIGFDLCRIINRPDLEFGTDCGGKV